MPPKKERLSHREFEQYFSAGKRYHNEYCTLIYTPAPAFHTAVAVPQKLVKKAVLRNRLRRQVYNIMQSLEAPRAFGGVYIFVLKKPSLEASFETLQKSIEALVEEVHSSSSRRFAEKGSSR